MKALGLVVSDDKIFENCRDHSCEVWSKSNEWFQRRCLSKKVYGRRTMTDDGQRPVTIAHPEHFVLRWAKKMMFNFFFTSKPDHTIKVLMWFLRVALCHINVTINFVPGYFLYIIPVCPLWGILQRRIIFDLCMFHVFASWILYF